MQSPSDAGWSHQRLDWAGRGDGSLAQQIVGPRAAESSAGGRQCLRWLLCGTWGLCTAWELSPKGKYPRSKLPKRPSRGSLKPPCDLFKKIFCLFINLVDFVYVLIGLVLGLSCSL